MFFVLLPGDGCFFFDRPADTRRVDLIGQAIRDIKPALLQAANNSGKLQEHGPPPTARFFEAIGSTAAYAQAFLGPSEKQRATLTGDPHTAIFVSGPDPLSQANNQGAMSSRPLEVMRRRFTLTSAGDWVHQLLCAAPKNSAAR